MLARPPMSEKKIVAVMAALLAVLTLVPVVAAYYAGRADGSVWTGRTFLAPGDLTVYLSYIDEVKRGAWLISNRFSSEAGVPYLNLLWLAVGLLARLLALSPLAAFHFARLLLIPAFAFAVHWAAGLFLNDRRERLTATALILFAGGWGAYAAPFFAKTAVMAGGQYPWPIDLWVAEAFGFLTAFYSPHFLASWILIIVSLGLLFRAYRENRLKLAAGAGLAALVLLEFHPFHAVTLYAVGGASLFLVASRSSRLRRRLAAFFLFVAISAPAVLYQWWLTRPTQNGAAMLDNNLCYTPAPLFVLLGFGALVPAAAIGAVVWRRRSQSDSQEKVGLALVAAWLVIQSLIIYVPTFLQRRFIEGLEFPLALLAAVGLVALVRRLTAEKFWHGTAAVPLLAMAGAFLFLPTTFDAVARTVILVRTNQPPVFRLSSDAAAMMEWMHAHLDQRAVVLSTLDSGNDLAGFAGVTVYLGHWNQTARPADKEAAVQEFFSAGATDAWRRDFLRQAGIAYVYVGPAERALGAGLTGGEYLRSVYASGDYTLFQVALNR